MAPKFLLCWYFLARGAGARHQQGELSSWFLLGKMGQTLGGVATNAFLIALGQFPGQHQLAGAQQFIYIRQSSQQAMRRLVKDQRALFCGQIDQQRAPLLCQARQKAFESKTAAVQTADDQGA